MSRKPRQASRYLDAAAILGGLLQDARLNLGLTQIEVAARSGVPYSTVRAIERVRVNEPCFFAVMDICRVVGLTPGQLETALRKPRRGKRGATG